MLIHSSISSSTVNGPGRRAVLWFQGCTLKCPGCWNPDTHHFDKQREKSVEDVVRWILSCEEIEGVTFSGGEPFQQAESLYDLCSALKAARPTLSLGVFSGYSIRELERGRWRWFSRKSRQWSDGTPGRFHAIRDYLDFGVFGRFNQSLACQEKPLCGSSNQEVIFFTDRYSDQDLEPQAYEINIAEDGELVTITGFPPQK
jgi:anaerobic ribonucleoside-triphosphate reductase activating protein